MSTVRSTMLALALALTVAAATTGATPGADTGDAGPDEVCAKAVWPTIPAARLTGGDERPVRIVPIDSVAERTMRARFAVAFEEPVDGAARATTLNRG